MAKYRPRTESEKARKRVADARYRAEHSSECAERVRRWNAASKKQCGYCKRYTKTDQPHCYRCRTTVKHRAAYRLQKRMGKMVGEEMLRYLQMRGVE